MGLTQKRGIDRMEKITEALASELNRAVIKYRSVYSAWAKEHGVSYNKMLVIYTAQDNGFCTQKQICESYLLPKQTVNHVFVSMLADGELTESPENNFGREKAYELTEKGKMLSKPLMESIGSIEEKAAIDMGIDKMRELTELISIYGNLLSNALKESE